MVFRGDYRPRKLSDEVVTRLSEALDETLKTPEFQQTIITQGAEVAEGTPESFARFFHAEYEKWGKVARMAGIQAKAK